MRTWLTADWHLGEDRFHIMQRPFVTQSEMIDTLVTNHNALVNPEDHVYVLGDVCYQKTPQFLEQVNRFNGKKTLVRGNHDRVFTDQHLLNYFDQVIEEGKGLELTFGGVDCYLTHYPSTGVLNKFNLVGHIHSAWRLQLNMFNVGIDANNYRPVDAELIVPFLYNAICNAYDLDVFAAYDINNMNHFNRCKKTSYADVLYTTK